MKQVIIGLVGHPSCGKDTVANYLTEKYNFTHVSTGDLVRKYISEQNLGEPTRQLMSTVSAQVRKDNGGDFFINQGLNDPSPRLTISGMRAVAEVEAVKKAGGLLLAITAPLEVRYQRALARGRVGEDITFEQFKIADAKDSQSNDPNAQNVNAVVARADATLTNTGTLEELHTQVDKIVLQLLDE